jgi:hypothetical protein
MNKYKGEVKGKLGEKERIFRLTFENIVQIEDRTSKSVMDIARTIVLQNFSFRDIVIVLHEGLTGAGGKYTQSAVGEMTMKSGLTESAILAGKVLETIFTGDSKDDDSPLVEVEKAISDTPSNNT